MKKLNEKTIEEIKSLYKEIKSTYKVSKILNVSKSSVLKYADVHKREKLNDKEKKEINVKKVSDWRKRTKKKLVEYKGGECVMCGYNKSIWSLEFHHSNPNEKDFSISGKSWSFERLKKEVDKCILVCSNCHGEIHEKIYNDNNKDN